MGKLTTIVLFEPDNISEEKDHEATSEFLSLLKHMDKYLDLTKGLSNITSREGAGPHEFQQLKTYINETN